MGKWERPESIPFPKIWASFEGKNDWNGKKRKYWIQDITEDQIDPVIEQMCVAFHKDEPLCKFSGVAEDRDCINEYRRMWKILLGQKVGLVCLTKDENGETKIAGMNCNYLSFKDEHFDFQSELFKKLYGTCEYMSTKVDPFEKFGLSVYLSAMGLAVVPEFRGEGIGLELLKAREPLCRSLGLKATMTVFTSVISQNLAARVGFKDLYSVSYADLAKETGKYVYPGIEEHTKDIKFMYLLYE